MSYQVPFSLSSRSGRDAGRASVDAVRDVAADPPQDAACSRSIESDAALACVSRGWENAHVLVF